MTDKTGGPANPFGHMLGGRWKQEPGMTLRDYFAGDALRGYRSGDQMAPASVVARDSYADADAMLAERDK